TWPRWATPPRRRSRSCSPRRPQPDASPPATSCSPSGSAPACPGPQPCSNGPVDRHRRDRSAMTDHARTVLVTGGSRGIGLASARALAAAGHRVAVTFSSTPVDEAGPLAVKCDVTDPEQLDGAVGTVEEALGPVEVLVANAGVNRDGLLVRMSDDDFSTVIETNLTATWRLAKRVLPKMMRTRWGRIIAI